MVAKVEWHPGELYPRVSFYNKRGTAEQWIKEGKNAIKWTRLSCRKFRNNAVRLQLHALAYNLANFMRTLALPKEVEHWSLTTLREKLVKIGAKVVSHGRYVTFQLAEVHYEVDVLDVGKDDHRTDESSRRRKRSPWKWSAETGPENAARSARRARLALHLRRQTPGNYGENLGPRR